jgi:hypothetical protein
MSEPLLGGNTIEELANAITSMAKGKAPRHNEIPMEIFQGLWHIVGHNFHQMISRGIEVGKLHEGITKGLVSLILKEMNTRYLNYWQPITLLTTPYKIFAKTLQLRL